MAAIEVLPVGPVGPRRWAVQYEGDSAELSRHATRAEAEAAARSHAEEFGYDRIVTWGLDAERDVQIVEPIRRAPTPKDVKGSAPMGRVR